MNWRAHPDYRGVQSFNLVSSAILPGVDHAGRAFLSLVTTLRYVGFDDEVVAPIRELMSPATIERASLIGAAMRVASIIAAGMAGVLPQTSLRVEKGRVVVTLPRALADLSNERLTSRVKSLGKLLGREPSTAVM